MSLERHHLDAKEALDFLDGLACKSGTNFIFRGHKFSRHRLVTSWARYRREPHLHTVEIDDVIAGFRTGLAKQGLLPFDSTDRQDWLEYARHYGVPMPSLDFSYSPYIALFFAFSGLKGAASHEDPDQDVVVYGLDVGLLATCWARDSGTHVEDVLHPMAPLFADGFPSNALRFIASPSVHNKRMHKQLGCLLYDSIDYHQMGATDLEDYIEKTKEPPDAKGVMAHKVYINKSRSAAAILSRLQLMGISGGGLFQSPEGVAIDTLLSYDYTSRVPHSRGTAFKPHGDK